MWTGAQLMTAPASLVVDSSQGLRSLERGWGQPHPSPGRGSTNLRAGLAGPKRPGKLGRGKISTYRPNNETGVEDCLG